MRARSKLVVALGGAMVIAAAGYGCIANASDHAPAAQGCNDDPQCALGFGGGNGGGSTPSGGTPSSGGTPEGPSGPEAGTEAGATPGFDASSSGNETTPTSPGEPDATTPVSPGI